MDIKTTILLALRSAMALSTNRALFTDNGLEPISDIDIDFGQYRDPEKFEVYGLPAIFIKTTTDESNPKNCLATIQLVICVDMTQLLTTGIAARVDVPIAIYQYQAILKDIIQSIPDLNLRYQSDIEDDVENVQFVITQTYAMEYELTADDSDYTDCNLESLNVKIKILDVGLVERV